MEQQCADASERGRRGQTAVAAATRYDWVWTFARGWVWTSMSWVTHTGTGKGRDKGVNQRAGVNGRAQRAWYVATAAGAAAAGVACRV